MAWGLRAGRYHDFLRESTSRTLGGNGGMGKETLKWKYYILCILEKKDNRMTEKHASRSSLKDFLGVSTSL